MNSSRSTNFMSPKPGAESLFKGAVLDLASEAPFAQLMVNSGRLSVPCVLDGSPLNGPGGVDLPPEARPGASMPDAPLCGNWLLNEAGEDFKLLCFDCQPDDAVGAVSVHIKAAGAVAERYLGDSKSAIYLIRPDQHIAARWNFFDQDEIQAVLAKAKGF